MATTRQTDHILECSIEDFRGISGRLDISFCKSNSGKPLSQIVIGDNGSGKSSIADALEFCLRGRLSRRGEGGRKRKREVRNMSTDRPPGVAVTLSRTGMVRRGGGLRTLSGGEVHQHSRIVDGFQHCPVVIRRQHIDDFWNVPAEQRQEFFFDYLREDFERTVDPIRLAALEGEVDKLGGQLSVARREYCEISGCAPGALSESPTAIRIVHRRQISLLQKAKDRAGKKAPHRRRKSDLAALQRDGSALEAAFAELVDIAERRSTAIGQLRTEKQAPLADLSRVTSLLRTISESVTADFSSIAGVDWIAGIRLAVNEGTTFSIVVESLAGELIDPTQVLSEAALDLMALLILTEMQIACRSLGQQPIIVFDDVFQSVDAVNRTRTLNHLAGRLKGWQIFVLLHDRLMQNLVINAFRRNAIEYQSREIVREDYASPPQLRKDVGTAIERLTRGISELDSAAALCGSAGIALEEMLGTLSVSLETRVTRRRDDRYTLGDLWTGVKSALAKEFDDEVAAAADRVDQYIGLRNLAGAHYNDWAQGLATREALDFSRSVVALHGCTFCRSCGSPLAKFRAPIGSLNIFAFPCKCLKSPNVTVIADGESTNSS